MLPRPAAERARVRPRPLLRLRARWTNASKRVLELDVPGEPLSKVNDTENFRKNLIMAPAIQAINAWWEDNKGDDDKAAKRPAAQGAT